MSSFLASPSPSSLVRALGALRYASVRFVLRAREDARLPPYLGSTIRGALARSYKRLVCAARKLSACDSCIVLDACSYAYLFETRRPAWATRLRSIDTVPHPLVIEPPDGNGPVAAGSELSFSIILFGRAIDTFPFLVLAVRQMAETGLGSRRAKFELAGVWDDLDPAKRLFDGGREGTILPPAVRTGDQVASKADGGTRVSIRFVTPTRLAEGGTLTRAPGLRVIARAALSRASAIAYFHCNRELEIDFKGLLETAACASVVESDLTLRKLTRYSCRQDRKIPLDGITGRIVFEGEGVPGLFPAPSGR